jgi:hypothetical protein
MEEHGGLDLLEELQKHSNETVPDYTCFIIDKEAS